MVIRLNSTFKPVRIVIDKKGSLTRHGYATKDSAKKRHDSLARAVRSMAREKNISTHQSAVKVSKRLTALQVLHKKKKTMSDTYRRDANWIRKTFYDADKLKKKRMSKKRTSKKRTSKKRTSKKRRK